MFKRAQNIKIQEPHGDILLSIFVSKFSSSDTRNPKSCSQRQYTETPVFTLVHEKTDEFNEHEANEAKNNACRRRGNKSVQNKSLTQMQIV